jgi:hypothetical protein
VSGDSVPARLLAELNPHLSLDLIDEVVAGDLAGARKAESYFGENPDRCIELVPDTPRSVQKLVRALHLRGGTLPAQPECPRCHYRRTVTYKLGDGSRVCQRCHARDQVAACDQCGKQRQIYRVLSGRKLCKTCARPQSIGHCTRCGRLSRANTKINDLPVCLNCAPKKERDCHLCGKHSKAAANLLGGPICFSCYNRIKRDPQQCPECGDRRILADLDTQGRAVCADCAGVPARYACKICGTEEYNTGTICATCRIAGLLDPLIGVPPRDNGLAQLRKHLMEQPDRRNTYKWLTRSPYREVFRDIVTGRVPRTHDSLKEARKGPGLSYLRNLLAITQVLPPADPKLVTLEAWVSQYCREAHPDDSPVLLAYATWDVLRRARYLSTYEHLTYGQENHARAQLKRVRRLLEWLRQEGLAIDQLRQSHLDTYLATPGNSRNLERFVHWVQRQYGTRLSVPTFKTSGGSPSISDDKRIELTRAILTDTSIPDDVKLLCLFVTVFGVRISATLTLERDRVTVGGEDHVYVRFAKRETELPLWLARLAKDQLERTEGKWLFPGRWKDTHRAMNSLSRYIGRYGINLHELQLAARFQLASAVNATILADTIGVTATTAINYRRLSGGWWADAVDVFNPVSDGKVEFDES